MLIAFCGVDGSGKTTQLSMLREKLENQGLKVHCTKQPTDWYRNNPRLRAYLEGEIPNSIEIIRELALLSATDRYIQQTTEIASKIKEGYIVISDRYVFSAYSYFMARGIEDINWLKEINKFINLPDLTFYLDIAGEKSFDRIVNRDGVTNKVEESDFNKLEVVRNNFLNQAWGKTNNYFIINALDSKTSIANEIYEIVSRNLK